MKKILFHNLQNNSNIEIGFLQNITNREMEVLELLMEGLSNKQISTELEISKHTVDFHLCNIYRKMGVKSRYEVISEVWKRYSVVK